MSTALITGASGGIGAVFAQELAARQNNLVLVARSEAKLEQLAQMLRDQYKIKVDILVQDLSVPGAATAVYNAVTQKQLTIDLLINNAGFGDYGAFAERPRERQIEMLQLNILALVDLTHLFLPAMQQRRSGSIINIASIAAFQPMPYFAVYAASKAFVLNFTEALWAENQRYNVRILALCPGPTETQFFKEAKFPESFESRGNQGLASPEAVVKEALAALAKNQSTIVTGGTKNKLISNLSRFLPRKAIVSIIEKQFKPK